MTTNHDYNTPQQGAENWNVPLNENFELIDADVEIRDAEENRSQYDPKQGAKYLSTDTKRVFIGDGSNWTYLATLGGIAGDIYVQGEEPDGEQGDIWIDTS